MYPSRFLCKFAQMRTMLLILAMAASIAKSSAQLPTVPSLDIEKYLGTWYEIARLPNSFEKDLVCTTANYSLKPNGKIAVVNSGYSETKKKQKSASGTAWVPDKNFPGRLKVTFFWPFAGKYYVISLDENYRHALVGDPSRKYLWILSRTKAMEEHDYQELVEIAGSNGFNVGALIRPRQDCD